MDGHQLRRCSAAPHPRRCGSGKRAEQICHEGSHRQEGDHCKECEDPRDIQDEAERQAEDTRIPEPEGRRDQPVTVERTPSESREDVVPHTEDHHRHEAGQVQVDVSRPKLGRESGVHGDEKSQEGPHEEIHQARPNEPHVDPVHTPLLHQGMGPMDPNTSFRLSLQEYDRAQGLGMTEIIR